MSDAATEVIEGMSYADYAARPGLRAGYLASVAGSTPGGAEYKRTHQEDTRAMRLGTAEHTILLQPEKFADYTIGGPINPKTGTEYGSDTVAFAKWAATQTKPLMTKDEHRCILGMTEAIAAHPIARTIRDAPRRTELSIFWQLDGVPCQARLDCTQDGTIWDIKTCNDANPKTGAFMRSVARYGYHQQAAWYLDGAQRCGVVGPRCRYLWLAVENAAPFQLAVYQCSLDLLEVGHLRNEAAVAQIAECRKTNVWPTAYAQEIVMMRAPAWMLPEADVDFS